ITIIFADLSGFTALSSQLDPEDVQEVANTTFEILNKPIIDQGGIVHKYEGDLVIALFGLPFAHEDDPERAIKAGLRMLELIPEVNECISKKLKKKTDLGLHYRYQFRDCGRRRSRFRREKRMDSDGRCSKLDFPIKRYCPEG
ncbi:MAG: adenylate/guanylate cyclase domain-containing protein, partial [candidate division WOR-3 bacterium]